MSTTRTSQRTLTITDGPPAHHIWDMAKHAFTRGFRLSPTFQLEYGIPQKDGGVMMSIVMPRILGVTHEDGSGQCLILTGEIDGRTFTGYYNARTRKGRFVVNS